MYAYTSIWLCSVFKLLGGSKSSTVLLYAGVLKVKSFLKVAISLEWVSSVFV